MFKTRILSAVLASALLLPSLLIEAVQAQATGPTIDKSSVMVWLTKRGLYYPKPGVSTDTQWSWLPYMSFKVNGPIAAGTHFVVEYWTTKTPFLKFDLSADAQPAGNWYSYDRVGAMASDEKASVYTGPVAVTVRAVNELNGLNEWLYRGTINVKKYNHLDPAKFPLFKNKFDYYVDQDWRIPFGTLTGNWYDNSNGDYRLNPTPTLKAHLWFKGDSSLFDNKISAHLFYQGKQVAKAQGDAWSVNTTESSSNNWSEVKFSFHYDQNSPAVFYYDTGGNNNAPAHVLAKHPGEYEIKVLHNGKLSRSLKFSVGPDGKLVDNGFSRQLLALDRWTVPVKVLAVTDGAFDPNAWKTGAYYGNPVQGFAVP